LPLLKFQPSYKEQYNPGGQDCVDGTANSYGLDDPGFERRWKQETFSSSTSVDASPMAQTASNLMRIGVLAVVTAAGSWRLPPTPFNRQG